MRGHPFSSVFLVLALLLNGPAGLIAWAGPADTQPVAHCGDMPATDSDTSQLNPGFNGCCDPGACHCGSHSATTAAGLTFARTPFLLAYLVVANDATTVSPVLARRLRPPIA
ncbi:MAG: hypothetical protein ABI859_14485 [Pseudomonadota bacterium]